MSEFTDAAKRRLSSVNKTLETARLEQQAAHAAYAEMEGDESSPEFVERYNEAVAVAEAKDAEVANLVKMASHLAGGIAGEQPAPTHGGTPAEILWAHPGMEAFQRHLRGNVSAEVIGRNEATRRLALGLPMFAVGATAESLTAIDQRLYPPVQIPVRTPRLLDFITIGTTDSDTVRYGTQTVRTSAAASRARTSGRMSQATYTWTTADATVQSVGHFVKAPIETLNDQGQLRTLLDGQLSDDLLLKVEDLCYDGAGTGTDFEGIITAVTSAGYVQERNTTNDYYHDAIRKGITQVQKNLFGEPNLIVMSPATWEKVQLERTASTAKTGSYLQFGLDASLEGIGARSVWGLPVVVTALAADDEILLGDFRRGATLWMRQGVAVEMSNSNDTDFEYNLVTIRGTFRAAFKTVQPKAFCIVSFNG